MEILNQEFSISQNIVSMISQTFVDFMDNYDTQAVILKPV